MVTSPNNFKVVVIDECASEKIPRGDMPFAWIHTELTSDVGCKVGTSNHLHGQTSRRHVEKIPRESPDPEMWEGKRDASRQDPASIL